MVSSRPLGMLKARRLHDYVTLPLMVRYKTKDEEELLEEEAHRPTGLWITQPDVYNNIIVFLFLSLKEDYFERRRFLLGPWDSENDLANGNSPT